MNQKLIPCMFFLVSLTLSSCGVKLGWPDPVSNGQNESKKGNLRIFVSNTAIDGKIGAGGVAQADSLCAQDSNRPKDGSYLAMISDGTVRDGKPKAQKDWVLQAKRTYTRPDGTVIGTTTADAVFAFPLNAAIDPRALQVWTGIGGDTWETGLDCEDWASESATKNGLFGFSNRTIAESLAGGTGSCDTLRHIYCVEQPALEEESAED